MEVIDIDGKYYDPYRILEINRNDDDEIIKRSFKKKAKKYHPDKASTDKERIKFEKYFKILVESYDYIKTKRKESINLYKRNNEEGYNRKELDKEFDNEKFKNIDPNDFGYGEYERYSNADDYKNFSVNIYNQFEDKRYNNKLFNRIFEWNEKCNEGDEDNKKNQSTALIHKTSDGFYGYNTGDLNNCALVNTFNGLMIVGDDFGESGIGYWDNKYGDYKMSYKKIKNPDGKVKIPKDFKTEFEKDKLKKKVIDLKKYDNKIDNSSEKVNYTEEENNLINKTIQELEEKESNDKKMVLKYINKYDTDTAKQCIEGILDKNATYISVLKNKRLGF